MKKAVLIRPYCDIIASHASACPQSSQPSDEAAHVRREAGASRARTAEACKT